MSQSSIDSNILPPPAPLGAKVAVCAPSGPVKKPALDAGLEILRANYEVVVASDVCREQGFLAGSDERRAEELNGYLRDNSIRAVIMARGGYGLTRILSMLDAAALQADPKRLLGFSDGTALMAWSQTHARVLGVHGPVVTQLPRLAPSDLERFWDVLAKDFGSLETLEDKQWRGLPLWGGNLCVLSTLVGTPHLRAPTEYVLFLEDVGEPPYKVDRYITQLHSSGVLDGCRGAWLGDFTGYDDSKQAAANRFAELGIRVREDLPCGHNERNWSIPMGQRIG